MTAIIVAVALTMWPAGLHADQPDQADMVKRITGKLFCQCGCGLTVLACQEAMTCSLAEEMTNATKRMVAEGKSEDEILNYFVSVYGEQVLALPPKRGFNLTAWITPFLGVAAGAGAAAALVWIWSRRPASDAEAEESQTSEELSPYEERVEQELRQWE